VTTPAFLRIQPDGEIWLSVKAQPRAPHNEIGEAHGNELKIKVAAAPVDSAANEALVRFIAEILGCARGSVRLVRGGTSRHKIVGVRGLELATVIRRLGAPDS